MTPKLLRKSHFLATNAASGAKGLAEKMRNLGGWQA